MCMLVQWQVFAFSKFSRFHKTTVLQYSRVVHLCHERVGSALDQVSLCGWSVPVYFFVVSQLEMIRFMGHLAAITPLPHLDELIIAIAMQDGVAKLSGMLVQ